MQPIMFSSKTWRQMKVCNNTLEVYVYWLQDWIFVQWYSFLIKMKHVDFFFLQVEVFTIVLQMWLFNFSVSS